MGKTKTKERPITMPGVSVLAILDGRKTQDRRVVNPHPIDVHGTDFLSWSHRQPYGQPGDILCVRETFAYGSDLRPTCILYKADQAIRHCADCDGTTDIVGSIRPVKGWKSSTQMPRWASRLTLEIESVRVERLQAISEADAIAEGMIFTPRKMRMGGQVGPLMDGLKPFYFNPPQWSWIPGASEDQSLATAQLAYANLWNDLNAKRGFPWESNPWVFALTFKAIPATLPPGGHGA